MFHYFSPISIRQFSPDITAFKQPLTTTFHFQKEGFHTIYERILKEKERLQTQIQDIQQQLATLPKGKLIYSTNATRYKWYQSDGHSKIYIPKSNRHLAEQLAAKKYLSDLLKELSNENTALDSYLNHHQQNAEKAEHLFEHPCYRELLASYFTPTSQELSDWARVTYERNPNYPEQLNHKTVSGNYVRSKSEAIIDMFLYTNQIPFRYECPLILDDITLFPDFTIRHPKTGAFYYWEHFGLMDDSIYSKNTYSKLQLYTSHGIVPTIQLITTYETKENPLSTDVVEKIIQHYFL